MTPLAEFMYLMPVGRCLLWRVGGIVAEFGDEVRAASVLLLPATTDEDFHMKGQQPIRRILKKLLLVISFLSDRKVKVCF